MIGACSSSGRKVRKPSARMPSTSAAQFPVARAGAPAGRPRARYWSTAARSAATTCVGGVKRHCPVFCMYCHWSSRSIASEWQLPAEPPAQCAARSRSPFPARPRGTCPTRRCSASNAHRARVDRDRAVGTHRVDDQAAAVARDDRGDLRRADSGCRCRSRSAPARRADRGVGSERRIDTRGVRRLLLAVCEHYGLRPR